MGNIHPDRKTLCDPYRCSGLTTHIVRYQRSSQMLDCPWSLKTWQFCTIFCIQDLNWFQLNPIVLFEMILVGCAVRIIYFVFITKVVLSPMCVNDTRKLLRFFFSLASKFVSFVRNPNSILVNLATAESSSPAFSRWILLPPNNFAISWLISLFHQQ